MVEVDATLELIGPGGPTTLLAAFEGRRQLIAYFFMCNRDRPAAQQCEGRTYYADRVFETYWTKRRGVESMDNTYALMDLTVYGRQERWEDSPTGWPQHRTDVRTDAGPPDWSPVSRWPGGRPIVQWSPIAAGWSDDLGVDETDATRPPGEPMNCHE
jgi:predicted dithiol-disulfide oxidoreductase (DUF899 family)